MTLQLLLPAPIGTGLLTSHGTSYLPSLLGCFFLLSAAIVLIVANLKSGWIALQSKFATLKNKLKSSRSTKGTYKGMARYWHVTYAVFWAVAMAWAVTRLPKANVVTEHNVALLRRDDSGDFRYISTEEPKGGSFRACPDDKENGVDAEALLNAGVGYIAEHATWEERGTCKSILKKEWGFWFKDEVQTRYRRVN